MSHFPRMLDERHVMGFCQKKDSLDFELDRYTGELLGKFAYAKGHVR